MLATNGAIAQTARETILSQRLRIGLLIIDAASNVDT